MKDLSINFRDGVNFPGLSRMHPLRKLHWKNRMQKLTHWLMTVAAAAPEIPMRRPKMNTGSRIMFKIPPVVIPAMA